MHATCQFKTQIPLFEALVIHLSMDVLQSAHKNAYLKGKGLGLGPIVEILKQIFLARKAHLSSSKKLIALTSAITEEARKKKLKMQRIFVE